MIEIENDNFLRMLIDEILDCADYLIYVNAVERMANVVTATTAYYS
jgi:hypothetical protein